MSIGGGDEGTSPREYLAEVRDYLVARGWSLDLTQVAETVFLFGGTATAEDGSTRRGVVIVAAGAGDELGREHLKYVQKAVRKYDADVALAHARNGADGEIERRCSELGIRFIDPEDVRDAGGFDESAVADLSFPEQDGGAADRAATDADAPSTDAESDDAVARGEETGGASTGVSEAVGENLTRGALHGAGAWVLGYLVVFILGLLDNYEYPGGITPFRANGWVFYGAHTVPIKASGARGGASATRTLQVFGYPTPFDGLAVTVPGLVYHLVPVIVLVGAGYLLVGNAEDAGTVVQGTTASAALGMTLVGGYLLLTVVGRSVFTFEYTMRSGLAGGAYTLTAAPAIGSSVLVAGVVYPILCGPLGAVLASTRR